MTENWTPETIAEALLKVLPILGRRTAQQMRDSGEEEASLMQVMALTHIHQHPLTTSELAKRRKVSLQSASVLVQGLVERGWVIRVPDPKDRRQSRLQVTPEGLAHAQATHDRFVRFLAGMLGNLTPEQLAAGQIFLPALFQLLTDSTTEEVHEYPSLQREEQPIHDPLG
jgi:DNA-binding MarR family transcriptional regulator